MLFRSSLAMNNLKWVAGINLIILLIYTIVTNVTAHGSERGLAIVIMMAIYIAIQVGLNLVVALVFFANDDKAFAKSFLLSAGIVLLIGFSVCLGSSS